MRVAVSMKLRFSTLDTNGKLRDARRLHSITFTSFFREALNMGATLFVTGEMKHHERLEAQACGLDVIIAGHAETENVVLQPLQMRLESAGIRAELVR